MKIWQTESQSQSEKIERFLAGKDVVLDAQLLDYELFGSMAHAIGLAEIGIITSDDVEEIRKALSPLQNTRITINPEDEDIHTFIEHHLVEELGELGEKIHTGRSRNDQVLVDLRLFSKDQLHQIALQASELIHAFLKLAKKHELVPMPGMTHTRFAMPSSIGLWAMSFADGLLEDLVALEGAYQLVNKSPLGSAAGYGVPLPLARERTAQLLGFEGVQLNPINSTSGRGKIDFAVISALSTLMLELSRLSADLIWGSSEPFGFFEIPTEFCTGSSIMPNKHNPDVLELMRAKAASIGARANQVFMISQGQISGYHRDHQELKEALFESFQTTLISLELMTDLIDGLEINPEALSAAHTKEIYAVDQMINEIQKGQPMRSAYRAVKENLENVAMPDPVEALKARLHIGGPGNLGIETLVMHNSNIAENWKLRKKNFETKLNELLASE